MPNAVESFAAGSPNVRQITKLKRFLTTLYQFAFEISSEISDRVRLLIISLVVSKLYCHINNCLIFNYN